MLFAHNGSNAVIPAQAGIPLRPRERGGMGKWDSRLRGNDREWR